MQDLDVTQVKVEELVAENKRLEAYLAGVDKTKQQVNSQMEDLRKRWNQTSSDNVRLRGEVEALRQAKKVRPKSGRLKPRGSEKEAFESDGVFFLILL